MSFEITGKLITKSDEQTISASFKKREFVIEVENERNSEWNDFIKFQLTQDKCSLIDNLSIGDTLKVGFNIRGRKWEKEGKVNYFSNLEAWRIDGVSSGNSAPQTSTQPPQITPQDSDPSQDLPF